MWEEWVHRRKGPFIKANFAPRGLPLFWVTNNVFYRMPSEYPVCVGERWVLQESQQNKLYKCMVRATSINYCNALHVLHVLDCRKSSLRCAILKTFQGVQFNFESHDPVDGSFSRCTWKADFMHRQSFFRNGRTLGYADATKYLGHYVPEPRVIGMLFINAVNLKKWSSLTD